MNHTDISSTAVLKEFTNCATLDSCFQEYWRVRKEHPEWQALIDAAFIGIISKYIHQDDTALSINPSFSFESGKQRQAYYKMKELYNRMVLQRVTNHLQEIQSDCSRYLQQERQLTDKQLTLHQDWKQLKEEYRFKRFPKLWQGVIKQYSCLEESHEGIALGIGAFIFGAGAVGLSFFPSTAILTVAALFGVTGLHEMVTSKEEGFITERRRLYQFRMDDLAERLKKNHCRLEDCQKHISSQRNQIELAMLQMDNIQSNIDVCQSLQSERLVEDNKSFEVVPTSLSKTGSSKPRTLHLSRSLSHLSHS